MPINNSAKIKFLLNRQDELIVKLGIGHDQLLVLQMEMDQIKWELQQLNKKLLELV